jgi:hypothetical protein
MIKNFKNESLSKKTTSNPEKDVKKQEMPNPIVEKSKQEWVDKVNSKIGTPQFLLNKKDTVDLLKEDKIHVMSYVKLFKSTGCAEPEMASMLIDQVAGTIFLGKEFDVKIDLSARFINMLSPQNEMEGVLISQMAGTHILAMEFMRRSILSDQTTEGSESCVNRASKFISLFLRQVEALERLRGKTGNQKVTVEHVYIGAGGQAIVGNVEAGTQGGDKKKDQG